MAMNPFRWTIDQQIGFWLAVLSGAGLGDVVGYFEYLSTSGIFAGSFGYWLADSDLWWSVLGGIIGAGISYVLSKI